MSTAMMAITTNSSISVNARRNEFVFVIASPESQVKNDVVVCPIAGAKTLVAQGEHRAVHSRMDSRTTSNIAIKVPPSKSRDVKVRGRLFVFLLRALRDRCVNTHRNRSVAKRQGAWRMFGCAFRFLASIGASTRPGRLHRGRLHVGLTPRRSPKTG